MKVCSRCKKEKPLTEFHRCATARDGMGHRCKECSKAVSRAYREKRPDYFKRKCRERYDRVGRDENKDRYHKHRGSYLERRRSGLSTIRGRLYSIFGAARDRARKADMECSITLDWVVDRYQEIGGICEVTGIELTLDRNPPGERFQQPFNPSLDRIDSSKGYTPDNVRLVCVMVNLALNRFGDAAFDKMCRTYVENSTLPRG